MEKSLSLVRSAERLNEGWLLIKRKMLFRSFMGKVTRAIFVQSARKERRRRSSSCARLKRQPNNVPALSVPARVVTERENRKVINKTGPSLV